jgi:hypothetical protein
MKETLDSPSPQWCYSPRRPMKKSLSPNSQTWPICGFTSSEFADVLLDSKGVTVPEESASDSDNRIGNNEEKKCPANTRRTRQACEACYVYKGRCRQSKVAGICGRCFVRKERCVPHQPHRRKRRKRRSTLVGNDSNGSRCSELENKIVTLCGLLDGHNCGRWGHSGANGWLNLNRIAVEDGGTGNQGKREQCSPGT